MVAEKVICKYCGRFANNETQFLKLTTFSCVLTVNWNVC